MALIYRCDKCGYTGRGDEFSPCDAHRDHGYCPKCESVVMWEAISEGKDHP